MSTSIHHNIYSQRGCQSCKQCEKGAANIGRTWTIIALVLFTGGLGLLVLPFYKKCLYCGHNQFFDKHGAPAATAAPARGDR